MKPFFVFALLPFYFLYPIHKPAISQTFAELLLVNGIYNYFW